MRNKDKKSQKKVQILRVEETTTLSINVLACVENIYSLCQQKKGKK